MFGLSNHNLKKMVVTKTGVKVNPTIKKGNTPGGLPNTDGVTATEGSTTKTLALSATSNPGGVTGKTSLVDVLDSNQTVKDNISNNNGGDIYTVGTQANDAANAWWEQHGSTLYPDSQLVSPEEIKTDKEANDFINTNQEAEVADTPAERGVSSVADITKSVTDTMANVGIVKPQTTSMEAEYSKLIERGDTASLETKLNDLNDREELLQDGLRQTNEGLDAITATRGSIAWHKDANNQAIQAELDSITRQKNSLSRQLNTKYNAISMIMGFKQTDYTNATNEYNNKFNQAMSLMTYATNLSATQFSQDMQTQELGMKKDEVERQKEQDEYNRKIAEENTARANLQVIYNGIKESGKSLAEMDEAQKAMVTGLEAQSGLPIGFYKNFEKVTKGGEIVTTSSFTDGNNNKVVSIITRDPKTGAFSTQNMVVGKENVKASVTDQLNAANSGYNIDANGDITTDAKVSIPSTTLAGKNNNPGNLRFVGQAGASKGQGGFASFVTPEAGYQALLNQINLDASRGLTVAQFVNKYAPPSENNTGQYISQFITKLGCSSSDKLSNLDMGKVGEFMAMKESGTKISSAPAAKPAEVKFDIEKELSTTKGFLDNKKGGDNHVSATIWNSLRDQWQSSGGRVADFDKEYQSYINTSSTEVYNSSLE